MRLINLDAAIDAIFSEPLYESGMKKRDADAVVYAIYEKIKSLPPAQPEVDCQKCVFYGFAGFKQFQTHQPKTEERPAESVQNVSEREFIVREKAYELATGQEVVGELIRCKDCKHFNSYFVECESESGLKHISDHHQWCCNAERREE